MIRLKNTVLLLQVLHEENKCTPKCRLLGQLQLSGFQCPWSSRFAFPTHNSASASASGRWWATPCLCTPRRTRILSRIRACVQHMSRALCKLTLPYFDLVLLSRAAWRLYFGGDCQTHRLLLSLRDWVRTGRLMALPGNRGSRPPESELAFTQRRLEELYGKVCRQLGPWRSIVDAGQEVLLWRRPVYAVLVYLGVHWLFLWAKRLWLMYIHVYAYICI